MKRRLPARAGLAAATAFLFQLAGCTGPENNGMTYQGKDFTLSVSFKPKEADRFSTDGKLDGKIEKMAGDGGPANPFVFSVEISNRGDITWTGVVKAALSITEKDARFFLPGYMYGDNGAASKLQPRLIKEFQRLRKGLVNIPFSPSWYMRGDQLTHPVAVMFAGHTMWGISGSPYMTQADPLTFWTPGNDGFAGYNGFYCSVEKNAAVGFTAGYMNYPGIYTTPWEYNRYDANRQGCISIPAGRTVKFELRVYAFPAEHESALGKVIENVYESYHERPRAKNEAGFREAARDISRAISTDAYNPRVNNYALIMLKPVSDLSPNTYRPEKRFSVGDYRAVNEGLIGWTNGAVIALPLLEASYRLGDAAPRRQGIKVIDEIVAKSLNPATGIPYCAKIDGKWTNKGWWTPWIESEGVKAGHSSYIVAQALYYVLKAYDLEKSHDHEHTAWLAFAGKVIDTVAKTQDDNGAFPRFWDEATGAGYGYGAFSGCWVAAAMAYYAKLTSRGDILPAVIKSEAHYYRDVERMECAETPLDVADSPDSEGVLAYIRLTKILSELVTEKTDGGSYLERMRTGLDYAMSFTFGYNVPSLPPPLGDLRWSSSGGCITSVCNAVIHCMTNTILDEIEYYCEQTGDEYYRKRLDDIYNWGFQVFNRTNCRFMFGKKGWSCEYFCQAERYVLEVRLPDGTRTGIWFAYHPWATASILEGVCGNMWENNRGNGSAPAEAAADSR